jgi:lactate permease
LLPYALLVALLLATRLVPPLRAWLSTHAVLEVPAVGYALPLLYSPGFCLLLACLATVALLRPPLRVPLATTARQWLRATAALVAFVTLSELMLRSGMTERLALATAGLFGSGYLLAAAWLGGLSGFLTGSNAAGAAMLLPFQLRIAEQLGISPLLIAALQNAAAAAGSLASPQRVVLAATVLAIPREEGRLVRAALLVELGAMAILTLAALVGQALSSPASPSG